MATGLQMELYNSASEITVLAVCFTMLMLLLVSFKVRMKSFRIFAVTLYMLISATGADLMLHYILEKNPNAPVWILYALRSIYHVLLFGMLHQFVAYTCEATHLSKARRKPYLLMARALFVIFSVIDLTGIWSGQTMKFAGARIAFEGSIALAKQMGVPEEEILDSKEKIVAYFMN